MAATDSVVVFGVEVDSDLGDLPDGVVIPLEVVRHHCPNYTGAIVAVKHSLMRIRSIELPEIVLPKIDPGQIATVAEFCSVHGICDFRRPRWLLCRHWERDGDVTEETECGPAKGPLGISAQPSCVPGWAIRPRQHRWAGRLLPARRLEHKAWKQHQRELTLQFVGEGHGIDCDVWQTRRYCNCKGLPRNVIAGHLAV